MPAHHNLEAYLTYIKAAGIGDPRANSPSSAPPPAEPAR
jgi:hypothetical protein